MSRQKEDGAPEVAPLDVARLTAVLVYMANARDADQLCDPGDYSWGVPSVAEFAKRIAFVYDAGTPPPKAANT